MNETAPAVDQAELQKRVEGFNAKLIPLLKEFKLGLGATAGLTPDGRVFARPQLFDDSQAKEEAPAPAPTEAPAPAAPEAPAITEG